MASVAIDGSKFKAVNNRDQNFTHGKVERRRAQLEESVARYLSQLDTADRHEPTEALAMKTEHLKEKLAKLKKEMAKLSAIETQMMASPDQQMSLTEPDSRSMATSGRGSGVVGYHVQVAVDTKHHLIVVHDVINVGNDRAQLAKMAKQAKAVLQAEELAAVADRGYFSSLDILECAEAADLSVLSGGARHDDPPLLDDGVSKVPLAVAMHDGAAAAYPMLGTRAPAGGRPGASRCEPGSHADAPRDRRASVRHDEGAIGRDALPDEDPAEGRH
jgi:hypothetical protein